MRSENLEGVKQSSSSAALQLSESKCEIKKGGQGEITKSKEFLNFVFGRDYKKPIIKFSRYYACSEKQNRI